MFRTALVSLLATSLFACAEPTAAPDLEPAEAGARIVEGSPDALGILAFLNDPATTFALLDDAVGLDRRAADALIHHRDGADGAYPSADDDVYDSIAEVDARYYVGASALELLRSYADAQGWVAREPGDLLGTWDGVSFTVAEAEAVLAVANTESQGVLDEDVGLDQRAVDSIVDARPVDSVEALAGLYYVGGSALNKLKDFALAEPVALAPEAVFAVDLGEALVQVYAQQGADLTGMGGNTLPDALAAVSPEQVWLIEDPDEDPWAHDLDTTAVYAHPDPIFVGSDNVWFGAYDRASGVLLEIYEFN